MLASLPVELVQLVALHAVELTTIASLARVCRFTAACMAEPAFWRSVAVELGVAADVLARIDDACIDVDDDRARRAALREAISLHVHAHEFDSEQRVCQHGIVLSANRHAACANNGGWNTVMSARVMQLGAAPRVLCFRVACTVDDGANITFRIGVTTSPGLTTSYSRSAVELPAEELCAIGEYDTHLGSAWCAGEMVSDERRLIGRLTIPAATSTPGHVVIMVARSATQPRTANVVMLVLHGASEESASAVVQLCFARRLKLVAGDAFSVIATLSGEGMGCVCMTPPRQLVARARELVALADEAVAPLYLDHMHGAEVDAPRFYTRDDAEFLAFLRSVWQRFQ